MQNTPIEVGHYYHVYNRGNHKDRIFNVSRDYARFLFLILYFQAPTSLKNISRYVTHFEKNGDFKISKNETKEVLEERYVELVAFCLMPNHFHLLLTEVKEGGMSKYMQRIGISYTKYMNTKHEQSGHLFQGAYNAVHIASDNQLNYLSAYIHRNPREMEGWTDKEHKYTWSSYQDYLGENRWGDLLRHEIITEHTDSEEYRGFVEESGAKEKEIFDFY